MTSKWALPKIHGVGFWREMLKMFSGSGSTISTLLHDKINPKDCQVLFLDDSVFLQFFRVVSSDCGKPRCFSWKQPPQRFSNFLGEDFSSPWPDIWYFDFWFETFFLAGRNLWNSTWKEANIFEFKSTPHWNYQRVYTWKWVVWNTTWMSQEVLING